MYRRIRREKIMNDEQINIWEEVVVVLSLKILYRYSSGENEEIGKIKFR
jgi:hypothetical protein